MKREEEAGEVPSPCTQVALARVDHAAAESTGMLPLTLRPEPYRLPTKQLHFPSRHLSDESDSQRPYIGSSLFLEDSNQHKLFISEESKLLFTSSAGSGYDSTQQTFDITPKYNQSFNFVPSKDETKVSQSENNVQPQLVKRKMKRKSKKKVTAAVADPLSSKAPAVSSLPERIHKIPEGELKKILPKNWKCHKQFPLPNYLIVTLSPDDPEFCEVASMFTKTMKCKQIEYIARIENPYLWVNYLLKREDNKILYGNGVETRQFHATKSKNIRSILLNNFDWRRHGSNVGHKYGQGVSFSYKASYASTYSDNFPFSGNKMLLVRLLLAKTGLGDYCSKLPPAGCDTTTRLDGKVCVKYEDNAFYPEFLISFCGDQAGNEALCPNLSS